MIFWVDRLLSFHSSILTADTECWAINQLRSRSFSAWSKKEAAQCFKPNRNRKPWASSIKLAHDVSPHSALSHHNVNLTHKLSDGRYRKHPFKQCPKPIDRPPAGCHRGSSPWVWSSGLICGLAATIAWPTTSRWINPSIKYRPAAAEIRPSPPQPHSQASLLPSTIVPLLSSSASRIVGRERRISLIVVGYCRWAELAPLHEPLSSTEGGWSLS